MGSSKSLPFSRFGQYYNAFLLQDLRQVGTVPFQMLCLPKRNLLFKEMSENKLAGPQARMHSIRTVNKVELIEQRQGEQIVRLPLAVVFSV
jgi:hypothetical protein